MTRTPMRRGFAAAVATATLTALLAVVLPAVPAGATSDDYPWRTDQTNSADSFGFTKRQCVSYAAWRLYKSGHRLNNRTTVSGRTYTWGSAANWDNTAIALHLPVGGTPKVGAVAQWNAYERSSWTVSGGTHVFQAGSYGHVAYVVAVYSDRTVLVRQYNLNGNRSYSQMRLKAPRYIYTYR